MKLGIKNALGLLAGYVLLMASFAFGMQHWLSSLEESLGEDTARLLAREHANLVAERSMETLRTHDADSRRRLRQRIEDLTLLSEVVSSVTVVDSQGVVVASDELAAGTRLDPAGALFGSTPQVRLESSPRASFLSGGDYTALLPLEDQGRLAGYLRVVLHSQRIAGLYEKGRAG